MFPLFMEPEKGSLHCSEQPEPEIALTKPKPISFRIISILR
jgi:hypothetical protein